MSSFKRKEPVLLGARRVVCAELESAIQALSRKQKRDPAGRAADALATARAAVELVGPALPRDILRRDRKRLDEIARTLDDARRGRRLADRLDKLAKAAGLDPADAGLKALRKQVTHGGAGKVALRTAGQRFDPLVYRLVAELAELRGHVGLWPGGDADGADTAGGDAPPPGLAGCYRAARLAAQRAAEDQARLAATAPPLSRLAGALSLVGKCCPAMLKPQRAMLGEAAKPLAAVAMDAELAERAARGDCAARLVDPLMQAGQPDREQAAARVADARRYALAETPPAFAKRVGAYWSAWRTA